MLLIADILRGLYETIAETLPGDSSEAQVFFGAFWLVIGIEATAFILLSLAPAIP